MADCSDRIKVMQTLAAIKDGLMPRLKARKAFDLIKSEMVLVEAEFARQASSNIAFVDVLGEYIRASGGKRQVTQAPGHGRAGYRRALDTQQPLWCWQLRPQRQRRMLLLQPRPAEEAQARSNCRPIRRFSVKACLRS